MNYVATFSGYSVASVEAAKEFYINTLGLDAADEMGGLKLSLVGGGQVFIYPKDDHQAATFTVLNFVVESIDQTIDDLTAKGVVMERYDSLPALQDEKGVLRGKSAGMGPDIAWLKDPSGNILAIIEE